MKPFRRKDECSGCTACRHSCPQGAIEMAKDCEGFDYPDVDDAKCTNCGLCEKVCPFPIAANNMSRSFQIPIVYAVKHKNTDTRVSSSSGGMFTALSDYILQKNGIIYGAAFDSDFRVKHERAESMMQREKLKGSKYVQSELGNIFLDIRAELDNGRDVLFTGTPCQIAGLKAYLGKKRYLNLVLCDLVCHGTPSPLIWNEYIALVRKKHKADLHRFNFRDKRTGWHNSKPCAIFSDSSILFNTPLVDIFDSIFYQHIALRPSCHACPFANFRRPSDITMADFWGIEKSKPHFDDNIGVSLVLVNTANGQRIFEAIEESIMFELSNMQECIQRQLMAPAASSPYRDAFWEDYRNRGFECVARRYTDYGIINNFKRNFLKPVFSKLGILQLIESLLKLIR